MARVITFSTKFPAYHPKAGHPTHFVEKVLRSLYGDDPKESYEEILWESNKMPKPENVPFDHYVFDFFFSLDWRIRHEPKHHTIRVGKRWKVGDMFSPRVWSGKPYASKQIQFAPDIEIKKVWDFEIKKADPFAYYFIDDVECASVKFKTLCANDGLSCNDMEDWFRYKPMEGQIICWNESVEY